MSTSSNVSSLLSQLTLEEKASLCLGADFWHTAPVERLGHDLARLLAKAGRLQPGAGRLGVRVGVPGENLVIDEALDELQRAAGCRVVGVRDPAHPERPGHGLVGVLAGRVGIVEGCPQGRMAENQFAAGNFTEAHVGQFRLGKPAGILPHDGKGFLPEQVERRIEDALAVRMNR